MSEEFETHSIAAEQELLGTILMNNAAMSAVDGIVTEDHFFEVIHQKVFAVCRQLYSMGKTVNPRTVQPFLPAKVEITGADGMTIRQYVARLASEASTLTHATDYAKIIRDYADHRALIAIGQELEQVRGGENPLDKASAAMDGLSDLIGQRETAATAGVNMDEAAARAVDYTARAYQNDGALTGVAYGLGGLDNKTLGAQPGELTILAGRPGAGKTALALQAGINMASAGHKVRFESLEMSDVSLTHRMIASVMFEDYRMTYHAMRSGRFKAAEFQELCDAAKRVARLPIRIEQPIGITIAQLGGRVRQWKRRHGLDVLIVDHLGYIRLPGRENQVKELGDVTKGLKGLARELAIPVILLCQLSRGVEGREDKRPQLSDLRASGNIEEDADAVIMVYRESYYLERKEPRPLTPEHLEWQNAMEAAWNKLQAIVEKNRNGPVGTVPLFCDIGANAIRDDGYVANHKRVAGQEELIGL